MTTPSDPLFAEQWHFGLIGDIQTIWNEYTGAGVHVGVYDEGVQYTHPDLAGNYDASLHFTFQGLTYDPTPQTGTDGHGTSCAGIIAAVADNGIGGSGVAYGALLTGVNYLDDLQFAAAPVYDAMMRWAAHFDVMSNSWGYNGSSFQSYQSLNDTASAEYHDVALWRFVELTGRGGLGTIITKAAGNDHFNANGDGAAVSRYTVSVSATEQDGTVASYSNYGSCILLAAPASAVTTDMVGDDGYNDATDGDPVPVDYTSTFNGTSAATPTVSGVVALMLQAAPGLGWRDVSNILALSAQHTGSAYGSGPSGFEVGGWQAMGGHSWNGGGTMFNLSYGYGMLDAFAAVRMAEAWSTLYATQGAQTSTNEQVRAVSYAGAAVAIPDSDGVDGTGRVQVDMVMAADITIESISITLNITHAFGAELRAWLKTPDGHLIAILGNDGIGTSGGLTWTFGVEALRGYSSKGTWSVVFEDTVGGDVGTVNSARLVFYGSTASHDDVFHFTNDFAALATLDPSRQTIDDTNGGVDWLNFAAVAANLNVSMLAGGALQAGAVTFAHLAAGPTDFENLWSGDGNDIINGNGLVNHILAMRGNDLVHGGANNDRVEGGDGNDVLYGDAGSDLIFGGAGNDMLLGGSNNDTLNGGGGLDRFVFQLGTGVDRIMGFQDDIDTLRLDDALWGGGKTVAQVISTYAHVVGANTVFNFGAGNAFIVLAVTNTGEFLNDLTIF